MKINIGAKLLSARLAKVLNILLTALTTCLCNAREHTAKFGGIRQKQPTEITAEVQGNYPSFKQKIAVKYCHGKNGRNRRPRAATFRKLTTGALRKKLRNWKRNFFPES